MKIFNIIIGTIHILIAIFSIALFSILLMDESGREIFNGIRKYKIPAVYFGDILMLIGGVFVIKKNKYGIILLAISMVTYVIGASYEIVIEHGVFFYRYIMTDYFYSTGVRAFGVALAAISFYLVKVR